MKRPELSVHVALAFAAFILAAALGIPHLHASSSSSASAAWAYAGVAGAGTLAYGALYYALRQCEAREGGEACQGTRASREFASLLTCAAALLAATALAAALQHGGGKILQLRHVLLIAASLAPPLSVIYVAGSIPYYGSTRTAL